MKIFLTGASGFIGSHVIKEAKQYDNLSLRLCTRRPFTSLTEETDQIVIEDLNHYSDWETGLKDCDCILHLAGYAGNPRNKEEEKQLFAINRDATLSLAKAAIEQGIKKFIFVSSIKVHGNHSTKAIEVDDNPMPVDSYGRSKWEAEQALHALVADSDMDLIIIRPALVFGRNGHNNFNLLVSLIAKGLPLPFQAITNKRSMILVDDLAYILMTLARSPEIKSKTYLAAHRQTLSLQSILDAIAIGLGKQARLFKCPLFLLQMIGALTGQQGAIQSLTGSQYAKVDALYEDLNLHESDTLNNQISANAKLP